MLDISVKLLQTPVLLSSTCANMSECQMIPLVGHVTINSTETREIGGIRVVWQAEVQRRMRKRNGKYFWTKGDIFDQFEVDVLSGPVLVTAGQSVFEFVIQVPLTLVSSRTTHHDKISHTLHAAILSTSPCYDHLFSQPKSQTPLTAFLDRLRSKHGRTSTVFDATPVYAHTTEPIAVFNCDTDGEGTAYNWRYSVIIAGLGSLSVSLDSQQLTLGGSVGLLVDLSDLSPTTTIHAIKANLVQTTTMATCPSKYSTASAISSNSAEILPESVDQYELYTYGTSWSRMLGRIRPYRGSYVWRGSEASKYVTDVFGKEDLVLRQEQPDGFGLSANLTTPSPIIGAHPTDIRDNPAFSTISHHLDIQVEYSILNQDSKGEALDPIGPDPMEGSVRTWTLEKELHIHSDLSSATSTAAPPYSPNHTPPQTSLPLTSIKSEAVRNPWATTHGWTTLGWLRPVNMNDDELNRRTTRHWEETSGMCACFDKSDARVIGVAQHIGLSSK